MWFRWDSRPWIVNNHSRLRLRLRTRVRCRCHAIAFNVDATVFCVPDLLISHSFFEFGVSLGVIELEREEFVARG